jgi:hypothetical protein
MLYKVLFSKNKVNFSDYDGCADLKPLKRFTKKYNAYIFMAITKSKEDKFIEKVIKNKNLALLNMRNDKTLGIICREIIEKKNEFFIKAEDKEFLIKWTGSEKDCNYYF